MKAKAKKSIEGHLNTKNETKRWDVVDHLKTEEELAGYLAAVYEDGDPALIAAALSDVAQARDRELKRAKLSRRSVSLIDRSPISTNERKILERKNKYNIQRSVPAQRWLMHFH